MIEGTSELTPTPPPAIARVRRIQIDGLFGVFNHVVELRDDARVTIILGPNGVGKTQLLECVAALFHGRLERLVSVQFGVLTVFFDDGTALRVQQLTHEVPQLEAEEASTALTERPRPKSERARRRLPKRRLIIQLLHGDVALSEPFEVAMRPGGERSAGNDSLPPWIVQMDFGTWMDQRSQRVMSAREMSVVYGLRETTFEDGPPWFTSALRRTNVRLIETQRLLRTTTKRHHPAHRLPNEETPIRFAVRDLTEDLLQRMTQARQRYLRQSASLDESYVQRFLQYTREQELTADSLQQRLSEITAKRNRLERLALLPAEQEGQTAESVLGVSSDKRLALALYASDMDRKLSVLEPLADLLERLLDSANRKLRNKRLVLDGGEGLLVETSFGRQQRIDLEHLSSGEQHEIVLLYDLLFRVKPGSLVLIDEPELSLHPIWQEQFVDDLVAIANSKRFDVVLATHSPYIVGGRVCLTLSDTPAIAP